MLSNPLKRALAEAILKFNEYQFAKYKASSKEVKLKDVVRIVHPKPKTKEQSELLKKIIEDTLAIPDTWEVFISTHGSTKENWETIMPKMPIMATLRNLRNFCKVGANIDQVVQKLTNEKEILYSKQFPYRFWSAYKSLQDAMPKEIPPEYSSQATRLMEAVNTAMELSVKNLPRIPGKTFMTADNSGSMDSPVSEKSIICRREIADLLQAMAYKICDDSITSVFGENFAIVPVIQQSTILDNMQRFFNKDVGHSTNGFLAFKWLLDNKVNVDRILMFSDMQLYETSDWLGREGTVAELLRQYRAEVNPKVKFYSFDLAGYGTLTVPEPETYLIAGWSDKVLDFINLNESKGISAVQKVDQYLPRSMKKKEEEEVET